MFLPTLALTLFLPSPPVAPSRGSRASTAVRTHGASMDIDLHFAPLVGGLVAAPFAFQRLAAASQGSAKVQRHSRQDGDETIADAIAWAKASTAPGFHIAPEVDEAPSSPEAEAERQERLRAAESMLGDVRTSAERELREALRMGDMEEAAEHASTLRQVRKLPDGIQFDEARAAPPDLRRWLDPETR